MLTQCPVELFVTFIRSFKAEIAKIYTHLYNYTGAAE